MLVRRFRIRLYLRILYYMGMLCAQLDDEKCLLRETSESERYAFIYTAVLLVTALGAFIYAYFSANELYIPVYTKTGNMYENFNLRHYCATIFLVHACLYIRRHRNILLVQTLLQLIQKVSNGKIEDYFLRVFIMYLSLIVISLINYVSGYAQAGLTLLPMLVFVFVYTYGFLSLSLLVVFFICLQQSILAGLTKFNRQVESQNSTQTIKHILCERQSLLGLSTWDVSQDFGLLILPIVPLVLVMAPTGPLYLISTAMEGKFPGIFQFVGISITASTWNVPWLTMMLLLMRSHLITDEANKTAKILSKIPRTGSSLDKMVQKFLLKNLRQQPILTAYGFFTLDRSTLFKLFTAIFTYMVILVQFKEMENSTKLLQKEQFNADS